MLWALKWLMSNRRKKIFCYLLNMHFAAIYYIQNRQEADFHLELAKNYLRELYWDKTSSNFNSTSFLNQWHLLRFEFARFVSHFFRFYMGKGKYFEEVLNEQYEEYK